MRDFVIGPCRTIAIVLSVAAFLIYIAHTLPCLIGTAPTKGGGGAISERLHLRRALGISRTYDL